MIALLQRPGRKMHLAAVLEGAAAVVTACDRDVLVAGAAVTPLERAVDTIDAQAGQVCAHCHRLILMAGLVHRLGVGQLLASLELTA